MTLRLNGSTSGYTEIDAPASAGNNTLVLPTGNGSNGQALITNGAGALSFQWNGGTLFYRNEANIDGLNSSTAQSIFNVGVSVDSGTVWAFEGFYVFTKNAGATSHTFRLGFSLSTSTVHYATTLYQGVTINAAIETADTSLVGLVATGQPNVDFTTIASAIHHLGISVKGTVHFNQGGIFEPTYALSAAPGDFYKLRVGSYFAMTPLSSSGLAANTGTSQGTWS